MLGGTLTLLCSVLVPSLVRLDYEVRSWREAVYAGGRLLLENGVCDERYVQAMLSLAERFTAHIVVGSGIAMPHARPEDGASRPAIGLIRLKWPITFPGKEGEPVDLVIPLAATRNDEHVDLMAELAAALSDSEFVSGLRRAGTVDDVIQGFKRAAVCSKPKL